MNRRKFLRTVGLAGLGVAGAGCGSLSGGWHGGNGGMGEPGPTPTIEPSPSSARGIALTIGLNSVDPGHYDGWAGPLVACEFDANDMAKIARDNRFEVKTLLTRAATRMAVRDEIKRAGAALKSGDIFLLSYSGHGGQVTDVTSDEEDNSDETWCLFDGELIDDELYALWTEFKEGVRILVFSDSCHSGTVAKVREYERAITTSVPAGPTPATATTPRRFRFMPPDIARAVGERNRELYRQIKEGVALAARAPVNATVLLISGCQDNQLSLDGDRNGLFTETLKSVYERGSPGNYIRFHSSIVRAMPATQTPNYFVTGRPNAVFEGQKVFTI